MATRPVQISIDEDLLREVDSDQECRSAGRSAFVRSALRTYLELKRRRAVDDAIRKAYDGRASELASEIADLLPGQAWPET